MKKQFDGYTLLHDNGPVGSLWLGPDHLLVIEGSHFFVQTSEKYRRLDYDKIQAVLFSTTRRGLVISILLALFLAFCGTFAVTLGVYDSNRMGAMVMGVFALCAAVLLGVHLRRGPTAALIAKTEVKSWVLAPKIRLRKAEATARTLAEYCAASQGGMLAAEESPASSAASPDTLPPPLPAHLQAVDEATLPPHPLLLWGYAGLVLTALLCAGELMLDSLPYTFAMLGTGAAAVVLLLVGISRKHGLACSGSLAAFWSTVTAVVLLIASGYIVTIVGLISRGSHADQLGMIRVLARFPAADTPQALRYWFLGLSAGLFFASGYGMYAAIRRRRLMPVPASQSPAKSVAGQGSASHDP